MLEDYRNGNLEILDELLPLVYGGLRRLAHSYLRKERHDLTLQTTALVHEAYLKLIDRHSVNFENRAQFFALSATAMRRILLDNARQHNSAKRGGGKISHDEAAEISTDVNEERWFWNSASQSSHWICVGETGRFSRGFGKIQIRFS